MKRFLSLLSLAAFAITSQMPVSHAMDMANMRWETPGMQTASADACNNSLSRAAEKKPVPSCCIGNTFPDTVIQTRTHEPAVKSASGKTVTATAFAFAMSVPSSDNLAGNAGINSPPVIYQKSHYRNLVGIVKNLN